MDILIITVLIIAAVILFLVELFVIPGISLAGISALACILYANYYAFANLGMAGGFITLGISAIACIGSLIWFMRSKMLDKLALKKDIDSKVDRSAEDSVKVGDIKYKDISGPDGVPDGVISPEYDRVLLGGSLPHYMFGLTFNAAYKGWDFGLTLQGVGSQKSQISAAMIEGLRDNWLNFPTILDGNYWSPKNTDEQNATAKYPRLTRTNRDANFCMSDYWLYNGRYIRLKNLSVGYTLPKAWTTKACMNTVRLYVSGSDLFTISNAPKGWDPEVSTEGYPITTSLIFGVSINF